MRDALADDTVVIPNDGQEHRCVCGAGGYSAWDCDGWAKTLWKVDAIVVDDDGRSAPHCHRCDRELEVGT